MTVVEMTHLADCPTCGRPRWVEAKCICGHVVMVHDFGTSKGATVRTECLHATASGPCGCKGFEEVAGG